MPIQGPWRWGEWKPADETGQRWILQPVDSDWQTLVLAPCEYGTEVTLEDRPITLEVVPFPASSRPGGIEARAIASVPDMVGLLESIVDRAEPTEALIERARAVLEAILGSEP